MSNVVVLFHRDADGYASAYAVYKLHPDATFIDVQYNEDVDYSLFNKDSEVYILDFSYKREELLKIQSMVKSIQVIDHHESAKEQLQDLEFCLFDMSKSGCVLSWEYFHPGVAVPELIAVIGDRDIWKYEFPLTREICMGFETLYGSNKLDLYEVAINNIDYIKEIGTILYGSQQRLAHDVASKATIVRYNGLVVGCLNNAHLRSEVCEVIYMTMDVDYAMSYYILQDSVVFSLRSAGDFSVKVIAKSHGGGGHKNAASYSLPLHEGLIEIEKLYQNVLKPCRGFKPRR